MSSRYGNRGMTFESLIEYANRRYRLDGKAIVEKQHTLCKPLRNANGRVYSAKYEEKATVDFMGRIGKTPVAFEAKHVTHESRISLSRVEDHQCEFLRDWTKNPEAIGFVIISFDFKDFCLIPWGYWDSAKAAREMRTSMEVFDPRIGIRWQATGKASISQDEIPEEWRIPLGGIDGLDWLGTAKRLWGIEDG